MLSSAFFSSLPAFSNVLGVAGFDGHWNNGAAAGEVTVGASAFFASAGLENIELPRSTFDFDPALSAGLPRKLKLLEGADDAPNIDELCFDAEV